MIPTQNVSGEMHSLYMWLYIQLTYINNSIIVTVLINIHLNSNVVTVSINIHHKSNIVTALINIDGMRIIITVDSVVQLILGL
jgi:hypothetical protein